MSKRQVYCAASLDGFIAGSNDDLSWLGELDPDLEGDPGTLSFPEFVGQAGAMLMGRRTFDVVMGFGGEWPYGDLPILVATSRELPDAPRSVSACRGDIRDLCRQAVGAGGDGNVYLDGGGIISQALDAGCVDEMILTVVPILLGAGIPIYTGAQRHRFNAEHLGRLGTMMQIRLTPREGDQGDAR